MLFDPENTIVKLCTQGMEYEMAGRHAEAKNVFAEAWEKAGTDTEKFTAAHYVARHQPNAAEKLKWDESALTFALKTDHPHIKGVLPSLYLNLAKGYEDLHDTEKAHTHYQLAQSYTQYLNDDGYGKMTKAGIKAGLERTRLA